MAGALVGRGTDVGPDTGAVVGGTAGDFDTGNGAEDGLETGAVDVVGSGAEDGLETGTVVGRGTLVGPGIVGGLDTGALVGRLRLILISCKPRSYSESTRHASDAR